MLVVKFRRLVYWPQDTLAEVELYSLGFGDLTRYNDRRFTDIEVKLSEREAISSCFFQVS